MNIRSRFVPRALVASTPPTDKTKLSLKKIVAKFERRERLCVYSIIASCLLLCSFIQIVHITTVANTAAVANSLAMDNITTVAKTRPILFLHVGPPKTGSTTLQCTLESLRDHLEQDNYAYIGRPECPESVPPKRQTEFRLFAKALVTGSICQNGVMKGDRGSIPRCWQDFVAHLDAYRRSSTNVIFSDEAMSNRVARTKEYFPKLPYPWKALQSALVGWDVRVLAMHRPLYDYLPSVYNDFYKVRPGKIRLHLWNGGGQCPQQGGIDTPQPFDQSGYSIANLMRPNLKLFPNPAQIYELFQNQGFNVTLIDMNTEQLVARIVCRVLPGAIEACKALGDTERISLSKNLNPSRSLYYDFIATEACRRGLFDGKLISRENARNALIKRQEDDLGLSANDLPLDCPNEKMMQSIFNASLDHERRLWRHDWDEEKELLHRSGFEIAVYAKKKLCTVNVTRVLQDQGWQEFFQELKQSL